MQYLEFFPHLKAKQREDIATIHRKKQKWVLQEKKGFLRYRTPYNDLQKFAARKTICDSDIITIGTSDEVSTADQQAIEENLKAFMPWRKGPFSVFGVDIDAEWRSEKKWQTLRPALPDLKGKIIADIGCNNGYYMFRMAAHQPRLVLGFEPSVQHYYCFRSLNAMAGLANLDIDLLGVEHLHYFENCFDVIFLMGIIYHRPSPIDTLRDILTALKPGGTLILETQAIPGEEPYALFPDSTYAKVPGTYFVPTGSCLRNWVAKAGFKDISQFAEHPMSSEIQRKTEWMQFESYNDYLSKKDSSLTIEGYPAPLRIFLSAAKKR